MTEDTTNVSLTQKDIETIIENICSFLGEPVDKNGKKMIKDVNSGKYFSVHLDIKPEIKSRIHL